MIDLSDGLALDLSRVCAASGIGARLRVGDVPIAPGADRDEALHGGEDYELLVTLPDLEAVQAARRELRDDFGVGLADIGETTDGDSIVVEDPDGAQRPLRPEGWNHFARR